MHPISALMLSKSIEQERQREAAKHRLARRGEPGVGHAGGSMSLVDVFRVSRLGPAPASKG